MALILSARVLQDTMSSESPQGSLLVFYLMEKRKRGGGMFDRASPRHSPYSPRSGPLLVRDSHAESQGLWAGQLPLSTLVCFGPLTSPMGF